MKKNLYLVLLISILIITLLIFVFNSNYKNENEKKLINTNFIQLEISKYNLFKKSFLATFNESNNKIYVINRDHRDIYSLTLDSNSENPVKENFISLPNKEFIEKIFILDISYNDGKIYVSAVNEKSRDKECYFLILYEYDLSKKTWEEIFKSSPCIKKVGFHDIGGKITHNTENIYLSGGNIFSNELNPYNYGGKNIPKTYKDLINSTNIFGSIVQIDKVTKENQKLSFGHRTPGGLFWDEYRNILWETEHGPRGGDELNIIKKNQNYGWPEVTYGREYFREQPSIFRTQYNLHNNFTKPFFSWTPSIGISQLGVIKSEGAFFKFWNKNELIVSSLKDKSLYRIRIEEGRIIYSERINIKERVRSLEIAKNLIICSTDDGDLLIIKPSLNPLPGGPFPNLEE
tara:strand:+ start:36 stop:1244 length:1209 start_codon:yes stop_codon:yes gene_type:complete